VSFDIYTRYYNDNELRLGTYTIEVNITEAGAPDVDFDNPFAGIPGESTANPFIIDISATSSSEHPGFFRIYENLDFRFTQVGSGAPFSPDEIAFNYPGFETSDAANILRRNVHRFMPLATGDTSITIGVWAVRWHEGRPLLDFNGNRIYMSLGEFDVHIRVIDSTDSSDPSNFNIITSEKFGEVITLDLHGFAKPRQVDILPSDFTITSGGFSYPMGNVRVIIDNNIVAADGRDILVNTAVRRISTNTRVVPSGVTEYVTISLVDQGIVLGTFDVRVRVVDLSEEQMSISYTGPTTISVGNNLALDHDLIEIRNFEGNVVSGFNFNVRFDPIPRGDGHPVSATATNVTGVLPGSHTVTATVRSNGIVLGTFQINIIVEEGTEQIALSEELTEHFGTAHEEDSEHYGGMPEDELEGVISEEDEDYSFAAPKEDSNYSIDMFEEQPSDIYLETINYPIH